MIQQHQNRAFTHIRKHHHVIGDSEKSCFSGMLLVETRLEWSKMLCAVKTAVQCLATAFSENFCDKRQLRCRPKVSGDGSVQMKRQFQARLWCCCTWVVPATTNYLRPGWLRLEVGLIRCGGKNWGLGSGSRASPLGTPLDLNQHRWNDSTWFHGSHSNSDAWHHHEIVHSPQLPGSPLWHQVWYQLQHWSLLAMVGGGRALDRDPQQPGGGGQSRGLLLSKTTGLGD